ncbi:hypothetical protein TWF281_005316 [Arthrobotrys megalospora]
MAGESSSSTPARDRDVFGQFQYRGSSPSSQDRSFNHHRGRSTSTGASPPRNRYKQNNKWGKRARDTYIPAREYVPARSRPTDTTRYKCSISGRTPNLVLGKLGPEIWEKILSYLPLPAVKAFSLCSRTCRFLSVQHVFRYVRVNPAMIQKFKHELYDLCPYLRHIKIEMTDIRWARHFFWEIGWYEGVTGLDVHFYMAQCVEPTAIVASFRDLSKCTFYKKLHHLTLSYKHANRPMYGGERWYELLHRDQQEFLGDPLTRTQAIECIESSIIAPPNLETVVLDVAEGLDPNGIYFKLFSTAPKLRELLIERWVTPPPSLRTPPAMFPQLKTLRVGLKERLGALPTIIDTIAKHFPGLACLHLDGFGTWWSFALRSDTVYPDSLDPITKMKNLKSLVMPCPAVLGPKRSQMKTVRAIHRLCPMELDSLLKKWIGCGMKLKFVTFNGYLVHSDGYEYFQLVCQVETKVVVTWDRPEHEQYFQTNVPASPGLVPCGSRSGLFKDGGLLGQRRQHLRHLKLRLELQSIRPGITDALAEILTQLYIFPAINKLSVTFVAHRDSESTLFLTAFKWISQCPFYSNIKSLFLEAEICDIQISAQDRQHWYSKLQQRDQLFLGGWVRPEEVLDVIGAHGISPPMNLQEAVVSISPQRLGKQLPYYQFLSRTNRLKKLVINETVTFPKECEEEEEGRKWNPCVPMPVTEPTVPNAVFHDVKSLGVKITGYPFGRKLQYLAECFPNLEELDLVLDQTRYRTATTDPDTFIQTYDGLLSMRNLKVISIPWPKLKNPNCPSPRRNTFRKSLGKWMSDDQTDSDMRMLGVEELEKWILYWLQSRLPLEKVRFNGWKPAGQWHSIRKWASCTVDKCGGTSGGGKFIWEECDPVYGN